MEKFEKMTAQQRQALLQSGIDNFRSKAKKLHARLRAPKRRYRLIVVDTFEDLFEADTVINDFTSLKKAHEVKNELTERNPSGRGVIPTKYYIYDEDGKLVG